jgi:capsid protein
VLTLNSKQYEPDVQFVGAGLSAPVPPSAPTTTAIKKSRKARFGYDAADPSTSRRNKGNRVYAADELLPDTKRRRIIESATDLQRNYSIAAWLIRKHLDTVAVFSFQAATEDERFNEQWESLMRWWGKPINFEAGQRHSLRRFTRLLEMRRVLAGDVFIAKMVDGRVQGIESDRVLTPTGSDVREGNWVNGIKLGPGGKLASVAVHKRDVSGRYIFEREIKAGNIIQLGYFTEFDQYRGVSPLTSVINTFQDISEVTEYTRIKAKVHSLFALAITKEMADDWQDNDDGEDGEDSDDATRAGYDDISLNKGPIIADLDAGDKMEFLESKHPSTELVTFVDVCIKSALKALDIPLCFYDESLTNYHGSKASMQNYITSCKNKRADIIEVLDRLTIWRIGLWVANGVIELPAGMELSDLRWQWIPGGIPMADPGKEVAANIAAVDAGFTTYSDVVQEVDGKDWRDVWRKRVKEEVFKRQTWIEAGLPESSMPSAPKVGIVPDTGQPQGEGEPAPAADGNGDYRIGFVR